MEASGNVPNSYWCHSFSQKNYCLKFCKATLKWELWFSELLPNLKYLRKLRRIHWEKQAYFCYFSLLPISTLTRSEYISHELQRQFKSLFHVSCQDFFRDPKPPLNKDEASNHVPHKHFRDQFCILCCTSSLFNALLLQVEVSQLAFWDTLQSQKYCIMREA